MIAARRLIGVGRSAVLSAALLTGLLSVLAPRPAAAATQGPPNVDWLVGAGAIGNIDSFVGNNSLTTSAFDNPNTYVTGNPGKTWISSTTASFSAFGPPGSPGSFEYALAHNLIPQGTSYVLYDVESWALTPTAEQQNPEFYMSEFVQLATDRGYGAILAPAVDLSNAMSCHRSADTDFTNYLTNCNLPLLAAEAVAQAAGHKCIVSQSCTNPPPIYEVQAQRFESNTAPVSYAWFASMAATQAHSYAPGLTVFAGISSNHDGTVATGAQLDADVVSTACPPAPSPPTPGCIDGYWLNVPVQGTACPNCTLTGDPESAAGLLWDLGFAGVGSQSIAFGPPTAAVVGTSQIVTATGSGSGSPVQLSIDSSSTPGACSLGAGGNVSFTGAGNCVIDANQAGATDWNAAQQTSETIPVAPANQSIAFIPPAANVVGASATLSATGGLSGNSVTFRVDPSSTSGACSLQPGGVALGYTGVGSCIIDANEAGNANYLAAPQVMGTVVIGSGTQTIAFVAPASEPAGTSLTLSATGGGSGNPVVFSVDPSSTAGTCSASGPYGATVSFLAVGSCVIDANQAPSVHGYLGAGQVSQTINVGIGSQAVSFVPPSAGAVGGTATLVASGGGSTQPVVFYVDPNSSPNACNVSGTNGDVVAYTGVGTCEIDATQQGDANFGAAVATLGTIPVAQGSQTIAFTPPSGATDGTSQQLQATGGASLNPVVFTIDQSSAAVCSLSGANGATVAYTGIGNCMLDLNEAGDANYAAAPTVVATIEIGGTPQSITFSPPASGVFGGSAVLSASGGASGEPVSFAVDPASTAGSCSLGSDGVTVNYTGVGSCVVDASEVGSGTYAAATVTATISIGQASQSISAAAPADGQVGESLPLTGSGGGSGNPIQFAVDPSSGAGVCDVVGGAVEYLAVGSCVLDAYQASSADYAAASATLAAATVSQGTQQISLQQTPAGAVGEDGLLQATTSSSSGIPVVFSIDSSSDSGACSISPDANSAVVFTSVGNCVVDANQAGDANYTAAPTATETIAVGQGSGTLTVSMPASAAAGTSAVLSGSGGLSSNPVVFSVDPTSGSGVCAVSGQDGSTVTFSAVGSCVIDANKAGDANYPAAASTVVSTIGVGAGSQAISFSSPAAGGVGSMTNLIATDPGGGTQPIVFSIDPSSAPGVCAVSGTDGAVLTFEGVGTCAVDANQAADANFAAAPTAVADVQVSPGTQTIFFTPAATATVGSTTTLVATTTSASGVPAAFSIDPSTSAGVCHVSGEVGQILSFDGVGSCVVDANEGGDSLYNPAPTVVATVAVSPGSQAISFSPPASGIPGMSAALSAASSATSGIPILFSVDPATAPGVCWVGSVTVHYVGVGQCTLDATEAGDANYTGATLVSGTIPVAFGTQQISPITSTPAAVVGIIATLTANGGATGNVVAFSVDPSSGSGVCTLSGSVVSYLAAGPCVIDATQAGSAGYLAAPMEAQTITVAPAQQVITFPTPPASIGEVETLGATTNSLNPVIYTLNPASGSGVCSLSGIDNSTVTYSALGLCVVDANAPGTANFLPATKMTVTIHVRMALQFITFVPPPPGSVGRSAALSATSSGAAANPIVFSVDPTLSGTGVCTLSGPNGGTVTYASVGTCVIDANQPGDSNYKPAPLVWVTIAVGPGAQAVNFTTQPASPTYGGTYVPAATGGASGNPVVLTSATPSVCTFSGGGAVSFVGAGTCTIDANQTGNSNYLAAPQQTQSIAVARASQNISVIANPGIFASFETVAATSGASGNPVVFSVDALSTTGACQLAIAGSATVLFTGVGNCVLDANQPGNVDYAPAPTAVVTILVSPATQTISFTAPSTATFGGSAALVASATSGLPVALTVDALSGQGVCTIAAGASKVNFTRSGTCLIDANQRGNADYHAAPGVQQKITVGRAPQAISFIAPATAVYGTSVILSATGGASDDPVIFAIATTSGKSVCSVSGSNLSFTGVGNCIVNANQAGNSDYLPAPQVQRTIKVTKAAQKVVITSSVPSHATYRGPTYTLTATGGGSGNPLSYSSSTTRVCTVNAVTVSFVGIGTCALSATQAASADYNAGSAAQKFTVYKVSRTALARGAPPRATLISSAKASGEGTPMAGNLAVRFQDGAFGLAVLVTAAAALRAWVARIVPPTMKLATVRSSHRPGTQLPRGYNTTR